VMKAGERIAGTYEAAMTTAGKQMLSLERYTENLKAVFGATFTPALAEIIANITDKMKELIVAIEKDEEMRQGLENMAIGFANLANAIINTTSAIGGFLVKWSAMAALKDEGPLSIGFLKGLTGEGVKTFKILVDAIEAIADKEIVVAQGITDKLKEEFEKRVKDREESSKAAYLEEWGRFIDRLNDEQKAIIEYNEKIGRLRKEAEDERIRLAEATEAERLRITEKANRDIQRSYEQLLNNIQDKTADIFYDMFRNTESMWENLLSSMKNIFLRWAAEIASQQLTFNVVAPALSGLGLNIAGGGGGGIGGNLGGSIISRGITGGLDMSSILAGLFSGAGGMPFGAAAIGEFGAVTGGLAGVAGPLAAMLPIAAIAAIALPILFSIFSQQKTRYGEVGPSTVAYDPEAGRIGASGVDVLSDYGMGSKMKEVLDEYIDLQVENLNVATDRMKLAMPEIARDIEAALADFGVELAAEYASGFEGFSISEKDDFAVELEKIINHTTKLLEHEADEFAQKLGFATYEALLEALAKWEAAMTLSTISIGDAFKVGITGNGWEDFEQSLYTSIYDQVLNGFINALMQTELFQQTLKPFYLSLDRALTESMKDGIFYMELFVISMEEAFAGIDTSQLKEMFDAARKYFKDLAGILGLIPDSLVPDSDDGISKAQKREDIARTRAELQIQLMELQGNAVEALAARRQLELKTLDKSLRSLQQLIYAQEDLNAAREKEKKLAASQRQQEIQLMELAGQKSEALAAKRLDELLSMDESLRSMQWKIYDQEDLNAANELAASQRQLEIQLMELQGDSTKALAARRQIELEATDESLRALLWLIYAQEDLNRANEEAARIAEGIASERRHLQDQLDRLTMTELELRNKERSALDASNRVLFDQIKAIEDLNTAREKEIKNTSDLISEFQGYADKLKAIRESLIPESALSSVTIQQVLAQAKAGDFSRIADLDISSVTSTERFATRQDYQRNFFQTLFALTELEKLTGDKLSTAEQSLDILQSQLDVLQNIDKNIAGSTGGTVASFASGGDFSGGYRLVGEEGPEIEFTGPSSIVSNDKSKALVDNVILIKEVRALREEIKAGNISIARNTAKTAKILTEFDYNGMPAERSVS
ncbi:MAG: hypothetical protein KKF79_02595, partial [Gammaproteobacteria bacterium]|nr:hypothetical protein [Gammaproteobacteria bacterium]